MCALVACSAAAILRGQQCVSDIEDWSSCDYKYYQSHGSSCACATVRDSLVNSVHPGFRIRQVGGTAVIAGIIQGSPADLAGLKPGDQIVSIDGIGSSGVYADTSRDPWKGSNCSPVRITINRNGSLIATRVATVPLTAYLDRFWKAFPNTNLMRVTTAADHAGHHSFRSYLLGIELEKGGRDIIVSDSIQGRPADMAGIEIGDQVISLGGTPLAPLSDPILKGLLDTAGLRTTIIEVRRSTKVKTYRLPAANLSELLFSRPPRADRYVAALR